MIDPAIRDAAGLDGWLDQRHMQSHWKHMYRPAEPRPYLWRWVRCVMPGEVAGAHRHNVVAIRFVVRGIEGAFTVVEGEPISDDRPVMRALDIYREEAVA